MKPTVIDLIRHGQTTEKNKICGWQDPELSPLGYQQMQQRLTFLAGKNKLKNSPWDICFYSPRKRCADIAKQYIEDYGLQGICVDELKEVSFGEWEGQTFEQVCKNHPKQWRNWMNGADDVGHGGESHSVFQARVKQGWQQVLSQGKGKNILLISHGGVMRVILGLCLDIPQKSLSKIAIAHAGYSRIIVHHHEDYPDWLQLESHSGELLQPVDNGDL